MAQPDNRFERAQLLSAAFNPIIDACVKLGVNTNELESLLRVQFVKRLAETLPRDPLTGKEPSHEEVGLAAGLLRGEVQNIRSRGGRKSAQVRMRKKSQVHSKSQRVLDLWRTEARFMNASGGPLALPLDRELKEPNFTELVKRALPGTRPMNVLKDLSRRGLIEVVDDIVSLRRVPRPLPVGLNAQALSYIAEQMCQIGSTLLSTLEKPEGGRDSLALFHVSEPVVVPPEQVPVARAMLQEQIASFIQGLEHDLGGKSKRRRRAGRELTVAASVYSVSKPR